MFNKTTKQWEAVTWGTVLPSFRGSYVWSDGTNTYYTGSYVLNGDTWGLKGWIGLNQTYFGFWTDGTNIYLSDSVKNTQCVLLPKSTKLYQRVYGGEWKELCSIS
jgi:hypothetical protein